MKNNNFLYVAVGFLLCILSGVFFLSYDRLHAPQEVEAAHRVIALENELYLASDTLGSKKLTAGQNIKMLFGEKNGLYLVGKGYEEMDPGNPNTRGTKLSLFNEEGVEIRKVSDRLVSYALFNTDGSSIVYLTPKGEIYKQNTTDTNEKKVAEFASIPSISPNGKLLAYKKMPNDWVPGGYADGVSGIVVTNMETGDEQTLTSGEADHAAFWTPDGKYIFFFGDNGYGMDSLYIMNSDGSGKQLLTNVGKQEYVYGEMVPSISEPPIISFDGRYFIYESDKEIWMNEIDIAQKKLIRAKRIGYGTNPQWAEDGKTLSVVFGGNGKKGNSALIVIDVDGNIIHK